MYYYVINQQGDVLALRDASNNVVASYSYNAWGELLSSSGTMANVNPLRYRGYYYDTETGFYYLQSRYYDPVICRFINADVFVSTGQDFLGFNMFAYCLNNPVVFKDPSGSRSIIEHSFGNGVVGYTDTGTGLPLISLAESNHETNRRPNRGKPGSTSTMPNGDTRTFGPDGSPKRDYDHDDHGNPKEHPHDENGGHYHDWENGKRGPAYVISWEDIAGVLLVTTSIIGTIIILIDDVTVIGIMDDSLLLPLGIEIERGFELILK